MKLAELLPHEFADAELASAALQPDSELGQRLEWLGDRALSLSAALILYRNLPGHSEEYLTRALHKLTSNKRLRELSSGLEPQQGISRKHRIAVNSGANLIEAYIGAIMLDGGFAAALKSVEAMYGPLLREPAAELWSRDPKSLLKETCEQRHEDAPRYELRPVEGGGFAGTCSALGKQGRGTGTTHNEAQQQAAAEVLALLGVEENAEH